VVEGPPTVQLGDLKEWTIVVPPMGPGHRIYHMELEVDWGQGETSRYVNRNNRFEIQKRFVRPGTYTVGLRLLERNVSPLLENKFIVKVIENEPTLDLQVTGPEQVTVGTPAFWTARTTRGRPPYEFSVVPWYDKKRTLSSESNVAKFNLKFSTPGKNKLIFQVVDADRVWSDWHYVNVLVTPEKNEATVVNNTQGGNTSTTGGTIKKDPPPDGGQQNGSGSGATPVGDPNGSSDIYGGLVIKGPAKVSVDASANLKALDHGGRAYASATWDSTNTEVLSVSASGAVQGLKTGHATVIVHVDDMRAYHDIEVVKGPFNPFADAVDDLKKNPNVKIVVKKTLPDGDEADDQGVDTGSDNDDSQSDGPDDDADDLDSMTVGGVSVDSDDEEDLEDDMDFKKVGHEHAFGDTPDMPVKPDAGDPQSNGPDGSADDLDSMSIGGISADPDDEEDPEDMLGFKMVGHEHESDNKGGPGLPGVTTDLPAAALADPYDLTGTWYLVNSYYAGENLGATHISPAWAQKAAVVRIEPRKDRYVGKIVRNGVLPGIESHWYKHAIRWRKGQEVLWVERKGKDTYEGQIMRHSRLTDRIYVIFKVEGKRTKICANASEYICQKYLNDSQCGYGWIALGFRISSGDNVGRYKRTPESDSINVFGTEVGD
jgi:Bacterial Ig-like domain (group 2)